MDTRGIESFANDLAVRKGPVSSRVALLLRSAEGKPFFASILSSGFSSRWRPRGPVIQGLQGTCPGREALGSEGAGGCGGSRTGAKPLPVQRVFAGWGEESEGELRQGFYGLVS